MHQVRDHIVIWVTYIDPSSRAQVTESEFPRLSSVVIGIDWMQQAYETSGPPAQPSVGPHSTSSHGACAPVDTPPLHYWLLKERLLPESPPSALGRRRRIFACRMDTDPLDTNHGLFSLDHGLGRTKDTCRSVLGSIDSTGKDYNTARPRTILWISLLNLSCARIELLCATCLWLCTRFQPFLITRGGRKENKDQHHYHHPILDQRYYMNYYYVSAKTQTLKPDRGSFSSVHSLILLAMFTN